MTREQQVALDAMREAWPAETVRAMLAGPQLLDALCGVALEFGRDMDIEERDLFRVADLALRDAHGLGVYESQTLGYEVIAREEHDRRENGVSAALSPAEAPAATSAHRPDSTSEINEALGLCPSCGEPVGNAKCWDCYGTPPALLPGHGPTPGG